MTGPPPDGAYVARSVLAVVLLTAWFAWPVLAYGALVTGASLLGDAPSEAQQESAGRLLLAAGLVAFVAPAAAALLAPARALRVVAVVELVVPLGVLGLLALGGG